MTDDVDSLKARLRKIDDYQRKGLMRAEEAEATRQALLRRLMHLVVPDDPLPRVPWRVHLGALLAMLVVVGSAAAYLLSGHAGLRRRSEEMLAEGRVAAAQDDAARRERLERARAGLPTGPDRFGRFAETASGSAAGQAAGRASGSNQGDAIAPLLSGRVELAPALRGRIADDDAVFIVVRLPTDPTGPAPRDAARGRQQPAVRFLHRGPRAARRPRPLPARRQGHRDGTRIDLGQWVGPAGRPGRQFDAGGARGAGVSPC